MRAGAAAGHGGTMKPTQALHDLLARIGARHEQLARTS